MLCRGLGLSVLLWLLLRLPGLLPGWLGLRFRLLRALCYWLLDRFRLLLRLLRALYYWLPGWLRLRFRLLRALYCWLLDRFRLLLRLLRALYCWLRLRFRLLRTLYWLFPRGCLLLRLRLFFGLLGHGLRRRGRFLGRLRMLLRLCVLLGLCVLLWLRLSLRLRLFTLLLVLSVNVGARSKNQEQSGRTDNSIEVHLFLLSAWRLQPSGKIPSC